MARLPNQLEELCRTKGYESAYGSVLLRVLQCAPLRSPSSRSSHERGYQKAATCILMTESYPHITCSSKLSLGHGQIFHMLSRGEDCRPVVDGRSTLKSPISWPSACHRVIPYLSRRRYELGGRQKKKGGGAVLGPKYLRANESRVSPKNMKRSQTHVHPVPPQMCFINNRCPRFPLWLPSGCLPITAGEQGGRTLTPRNVSYTATSRAHARDLILSLRGVTTFNMEHSGLSEHPTHRSSVRTGLLRFHSTGT